MKKGFTLVELLGVIVVLAIISMIAVPLIDRSINKSDEDLYNTQINQIVKAAKNYYAENLEKLNQVGEKCDTSPCDAGDSKPVNPCCVTLDTLQKGGYLPTKVDNPKTGEPFNPTLSYVTVTKKGNHFEYKATVVDAGGETN